MNEILYNDLPDWSRRLSVRRINAARKPHLCAIGGHEIPAGSSYTRIVHLIHSGKIVTTCSCDESSVCYVGNQENDSISDLIGTAFQALRAFS